MERLYPDRVFRLNDNIENWKAVRGRVLRTGDSNINQIHKGTIKNNI